MTLIKVIISLCILKVSFCTPLSILKELSLKSTIAKNVTETFNAVCFNNFSGAFLSFKECIFFSSCEKYQEIKQIKLNHSQYQNLSDSSLKVDLSGDITNDSKLYFTKEYFSLFGESFVFINQDPEMPHILVCYNDDNPNKYPEQSKVELNTLTPKENNRQIDRNPSTLLVQVQLADTAQISSYLKTETCLITETFTWIITAIILFSLFNSMGTSGINGIYFFINLVQSNNLLAYINYPFPSNFICFYNSLEIFNFKTFLNIPAIIKQYFLNNVGIYQISPEIFGAFGFSSDWFENAGKAITPFIILLFVLAIIKFLQLIKFGSEIFPIILDQIQNKIIWNGVIRTFQITFLALLLASILELRNFSFETKEAIISFGFAAFTCFLLILTLLKLIKIIRSSNLRDQNYINKLGAIYNEYWLDKNIDFFTVSLEIFILIKKAIQLSALIFLDTYPSLQTIIFLATESCQTLLFYSKRRLKDKTTGKIVNFINFSNFLIILTLCFFFLIEQNQSLIEAIEWIVISLSIFLYFVNLILIIAEQILVKEEILNFYKEICYGIWIFILSLFSCFCCVCIGGYQFYWSRRGMKNDVKKSSRSTELSLL